ncbi:hypothetical protein D3C71_1921460 [compost metagenome]
MIAPMVGSYSGRRGGTWLRAIRVQFVRMLPGSMAMALTPNGLTSLASEAVKPLTAHFAAL